MISYQYCKMSPSPILVTDTVTVTVTDTRHRHITVTNNDITCEMKNNIDVIVNNSLPLFLIYITQLLLITVLLYYCALAFYFIHWHWDFHNVQIQSEITSSSTLSTPLSTNSWSQMASVRLTWLRQPITSETWVEATFRPNWHVIKLNYCNLLAIFGNPVSRQKILYPRVVELAS